MTIISELRRKKNISMKQAAKDLGIAYTTYVNYEKGERQPNSEVLIALADYFGVSVDYLIGRHDSIFDYDGVMPLPKIKRVPLLGRIACGEPILAEENLDGFVNCPEHIPADFSLVCKGDSMINARIFDGDIVFIRQQPDVNDGDIAAVLIDDSATLKKVKHLPNKLILSPCNPLYDDIIFRDEELNSVTILGKAVYFLSSVR